MDRDFGKVFVATLVAIALTPFVSRMLSQTGA